MSHFLKGSIAMKRNIFRESKNEPRWQNKQRKDIFLKNHPFCAMNFLDFKKPNGEAFCYALCL